VFAFQEPFLNRLIFAITFRVDHCQVPHLGMLQSYSQITDLVKNLTEPNTPAYFDVVKLTKKKVAKNRYRTLILTQRPVSHITLTPVSKKLFTTVINSVQQRTTARITAVKGFMTETADIIFISIFSKWPL